MTLPQPIPGAVPPASAADEQQATIPQQQRPRAPATTRNGRSRSNTYAYNRLDADGNVHHLPPDAPALSSSRSRRSPPGSRSPTTTSAHSPAGPTSALSGGGGGILELLGLSPRSSTSNALHIPFASSSGSGSSRPSGPAHGAGEPGPSPSPSASPASSVTSADEMPRTPGAVTPPELSVGMSMSTLTDTDTGLGKSTRTRRGGEWSTARALDIDYALDGDAFDEDSSTVVPELASSASSRRWQRAQAQGHGRGYGHHRSSSVVDRSRDTTAPSLAASTSTSASAAPHGTGAKAGYAGGAELGRRVSWSPGFYESGSSSSANSGPGRSSVLSWLHGQQSSSSSLYGSPPAANANVSAGGAGDSGNNPVGLFRRLSISSRRPVAATLAPASAANTADERIGRPAAKATSPAPRKLSPMGERMLRSDSSLFS